MFEYYLLVNPPTRAELEIACQAKMKITIEAEGNRKYLFLPNGEILSDDGFMGTCWDITSQDDGREAVVALKPEKSLAMPMLQFLD